MPVARLMGYVPPRPPLPPPNPDLIGGWDAGEMRTITIHGQVSGAPIRLNVDRHGMPRDYATYMWLLYKRVVKDESPARMAFLYGPTISALEPFFGIGISFDTR